MVGDIGAALAWLGIITAVCTAATTCITGYFIHQRKLAKMKYEDAARIRAEESMLTGDHLELRLTKAKADLFTAQRMSRY